MDVLRRGIATLTDDRGTRLEVSWPIPADKGDTLTDLEDAIFAAYRGMGGDIDGEEATWRQTTVRFEDTPA